MNPELLQLIERWRERHPEARPPAITFLTDDVWVDTHGTWNDQCEQRIALALIEVAVMDWLEESEIWVEVWPGEYDEEDDDHTSLEVAIGRFGQNGNSDGKAQAPTRLHALLLAVEEMEAK